MSIWISLITNSHGVIMKTSETSETKPHTISLETYSLCSQSPQDDDNDDDATVERREDEIR